MSPQISDRKWACIGAAALTGLAAAIVFGIHPGGFEGQVAWLFALLPATLAVHPFSDCVYMVAPHVERGAFWILVITFNFAWYWGVSYGRIKIRRFLVGT